MERNQIKWDLIKNKSSYDIPWSMLRIALIIILTHCEFDLLILDEPTFGLGWTQKVNLLQYLQRYLKQKHIIVISHDVEFVQSICNVVLSLDDDSVTISDLIQIERKDT
jgi:ATPase subunit of ABC transporter with duplicated ATPase domains